MGIGNFFGMLPEKMQESRLYGVELDGITGGLQNSYIRMLTLKSQALRKRIIPMISLM